MRRPTANSPIHEAAPFDDKKVTSEEAATEMAIGTATWRRLEERPTGTMDKGLNMQRTANLERADIGRWLTLGVWWRTTLRWYGRGPGRGRVVWAGKRRKWGAAVGAILLKTSVGKVHAVYSHRKRW